MKILVCISKAPDTTSKIAFTDNNTAFDKNGVQFIINPYDEWYALVRGLELKEANGGSVTILNVGGADNDPTIRKALAIGADDAVRINMEPTDALGVAKQIADYAKENAFDMGSLWERNNRLQWFSSRRNGCCVFGSTIYFECF